MFSSVRYISSSFSVPVPNERLTFEAWIRFKTLVNYDDGPLNDTHLLERIKCDTTKRLIQKE